MKSCKKAFGHGSCPSCSLKNEYQEWMTSSQAAEYLGISQSRLFNMVSNGRIPYYKFGRSNRYLVSELRELLLSQPKGVRYGDQI